VKACIPSWCENSSCGNRVSNSKVGAHAQDAGIGKEVNASLCTHLIAVNGQPCATQLNRFSESSVASALLCKSNWLERTGVERRTAIGAR
jgi:hypothetical protein